MAKALFGHMATADPRLLAEIQRLRLRVSDLEQEVARLQAEASIERSFFTEELAADLREPAQV